MKYQVEITETLFRVVEVDADSVEDAVRKVEEDYEDCKINLDGDDCISFDIKEYKG